ncbi:MAG TPA: CrcB family protein [Candidatus Anaerobiospirillum pullistercoris]|uniref:Fluoride-specific ion channel n=1 Tax=Candidatus Anaerobiospirillum pullistercoris TaxID=2838452 RepID=A0A9D1WCP0_9GAMM|nr:CrcB family protein [Candidatus Anaerobiospirillum pullistercoris]
MDRALTLMVVFFGGGIGCVLRLLIDGNTTNPFTITNVCACLLMGASYSLICYRVLLTNKFVISFVNVGFLGGLSTITPLAIYVLHTDLVSNWFMALLLLIGQIIFFVVVSVIGYIVTSAVLQYGLHKKRHMSRLESGRNLAIYNSTLPNYHQIKERYEQLKALNINFKESQHDPIVGQMINELKVLTTNHIMTLTSLNRQYIQNLKKEKCVLTPINEFTRISRDESQFIGENEPTYSEQMALIKTMRQDIKDLLPPFPDQANSKSIKSDYLWDILLNSGDQEIIKTTADQAANTKTATTTSAPNRAQKRAQSASKKKQKK